MKANPPATLRPGRHFFAIVLVLLAAVVGATAATLTVTTTNDSGQGSLRERIEASGIGDTIVFANSVTGTITLANGEISLATNLKIRGPGAGQLTVNGSDRSRVFNVAVDGIAVTICDLTMAEGFVASDFGGAIFNRGFLTLSNCVVARSRCTMDSEGHGGYGGGIYCEQNSSLIMVGSTLWGNDAGYSGGALSAQAGATMVIRNSTISSNTAFASGGGISIYIGSVLRIDSCTIASNRVTAANGAGGGLLRSTLSSLRVTNSIVAANTAANGPDVRGTFVSGGYNLIGRTNDSTGFSTTSHDQVGNTNAPIDPGFGPLQDIDAPTPTMALLPGSPAIDQGNSFGVTTDQRGARRPFDKLIANATGGDGSDIGAFEVGGLARLLEVVQSGTDLRVSFSTDAGQNYELQHTQDLGSGNWTTVASDIPGTGGRVTITDSDAAQFSPMFYRVRLMP